MRLHYISQPLHPNILAIYLNNYYGGISMKKKILLLTTLFVSLFFVSCSNKRSQPKLEDLTYEDINKITILSLEAGQMIEVTKIHQIENILIAIRELPLYIKSNRENTYNNHLIQYTLHTSSGESLTIELLDTWIGYNNTWYLCDQSACKTLTDMAYQFLP